MRIEGGTGEQTSKQKCELRKSKGCTRLHAPRQPATTVRTSFTCCVSCSTFCVTQRKGHEPQPKTTHRATNANTHRSQLCCIRKGLCACRFTGSEEPAHTLWHENVTDTDRACQKAREEQSVRSGEQHETGGSAVVRSTAMGHTHTHTYIPFSAAFCCRSTSSSRCCVACNASRSTFDARWASHKLCVPCMCVHAGQSIT